VGTVRSEAKANDVFAAHPDFKNRVRLVAVPNMSSPGAYDKILKETQFDYVIHTASPVPDGAGTDFDKDFLEPAVQGCVVDPFEMLSKTLCPDNKAAISNCSERRTNMQNPSSTSPSLAAWLPCTM
jgi:hypothetical protein